MQPEVVKQGGPKKAPQAPAAQALAPAQTQALSTELSGSWGSEGVDANDVLVPRILLMQALSKLVSAGERNTSDIIRSTTKEVLAKKGDTFEVIPIRLFKTFTIFDCSGKKPEFRSIEPITPENLNAPLEYMVDGKPYRRDRSLNFYVLLPKDIIREQKAKEAIAKGEYPDTDDILFPAVLSFSRSSYLAGRELATHFKKAEAFGIPPASRVFKLGSKLASNDQGTWPVFTVEKARPSSQEELAAAKRWYDVLAKSSVRIDDVEDESAAPAPVVDGAQDAF